MQYQQKEPNSPSSLSILIVGDGDFSCSLAIKRAYPNLISSMTATTLLPSKEKLTETYPHASHILQQLERENVKLIYNVNATELHSDSRFSESSFDLISFHHPHLGYPDASSCAKDPQDDLNTKHASLIRDYLFSSSTIQKREGSYVHVCLTGGSVENWKLLETVKALNLEFRCNSPFVASKPMLQYFTSGHSIIDGKDSSDAEMDPNNMSSPATNGDDEAASSSASAVEQKLKECVRAKRKGHWLGKYGYRHQPTYPHETVFQTNKSNSVHIFLG